MAAENEKERAPAPAARWTVCGGRSEAVLDSRARAACLLWSESSGGRVVAVISSAVGDPFTRYTPGARVLCLSTRMARGAIRAAAAGGWVVVRMKTVRIFIRPSVRPNKYEHLSG